MTTGRALRASSAGRRPNRLRAAACAILLAAACGAGPARAADACGGQPLETVAPAMPTREVQLAVHRQNLGAIRRDQDVVLVGDSLVQFWPSDLASRALGARHLLNFGVGLDRTQHVLWRLEAPELKTLHPRLVVLLVGTNNLKAGDDACAIAAGIDAVADRIRDLWPRSRLMIIGIPPRGSDFSYRNADRVAINTHLGAGSSDPGRSFVDVDAAIACGFTSPCENYLSDAVHLSEPGYQVLSALLKDRVARAP